MNMESKSDFYKEKCLSTSFFHRHFSCTFDANSCSVCWLETNLENVKLKRLQNQFQTEEGKILNWSPAKIQQIVTGWSHSSQYRLTLRHYWWVVQARKISYQYVQFYSILIRILQYLTHILLTQMKRQQTIVAVIFISVDRQLHLLHVQAIV